MAVFLGEITPLAGWPFINGCRSILRKDVFLAGPPTKVIEEVLGILPTALTGVANVDPVPVNCLVSLLLTFGSVS